MATTKKKAGERREPGVYLRTDGRPRFELKVRWTNADGSKGYTPTRIFPFDPEAKGGPTCRAHALDSANKTAIEERAALRLHDKPRAQLAEAWTFGGLLEQLIVEQKALISGDVTDKAEDAKKNTKHVRQRISYARMLLGQSSIEHTANIEGFPDLCALPLRSLTPAHFSGKSAPNSLASRLKGKGGRPAPADSVRRLMSFLSWTFQHAKSDWEIDCVNPIERWKALKLSPSDRGRDRTLSDAEWTKIQSALEAAWPDTQAAIYTARYTAARRGEVVKLDWEDLKLDGENATALLRDTKSKRKNDPNSQPRNRTIPLPPEVARRLLELQARVGGREAKGAVFIGQEGTRIGADTLTQAWGRACARAGVKGARLHDLRHTRITELGHRLNPLQVAAISGHDDLGTLKRYFNATAEELGEILDKVELEKQDLDAQKALADAIKALSTLTAAARAQANKK